MGVLRGEFKIQAMYVDVLSEGFRTRVRFPPPPPICKAKAPRILGLYYFNSQMVYIDKLLERVDFEQEEEYV